MELTPYVEAVRAGVTNAAALADDHTRYVAEQLGAAVDSAARLALLQALSDAAATISADLAPGSVELRMVGSEPEFAVTAPSHDAEPTMLRPEDDPDPTVQTQLDLDDEPVARVSLRLPQSVKTRVDERADAEGISTNAWLIRCVLDGLVDDGRGPGPRPPQPFPLFGPNGPFGEHGVFGPHGPFGRGGHKRLDDPTRSSGTVQGWVR